jgi:hypothetical protein
MGFFKGKIRNNQEEKKRGRRGTILKKANDKAFVRGVEDI